jgi:hypothetical protein
MSNINGKVYAMNAVTPMKPWKTWILRVIFWALGVFKPAQKDLINLAFIQFARWVIIPHDRFPYLGEGQKKEALHYDYLFFFSNFNGTWNQYIDAFYPEATLNDVQSAIVVDQALGALCRSAAKQTPEEFRQAYLQFVITCQSHLGSTGEAPTVF